MCSRPCSPVGRAGQGMRLRRCTPRGAPSKQAGELTPRPGALSPSAGPGDPSTAPAAPGCPQNTQQWRRPQGGGPAGSPRHHPPAPWPLWFPPLALMWTWRPVTQSEFDRGYSTCLFSLQVGFSVGCALLSQSPVWRTRPPQRWGVAHDGVCWGPGPGDRPLAHQDKQPVLQQELSLGASASATGLPGWQQEQRGRGAPAH